MTINDLTDKQRSLIAEYIEKASNGELSRICEDLDANAFRGWTNEEKDGLCEMLREWNSGGEDPYPESVEYIQSGLLVSFGAWLISPDAQESTP